MCVVTQFQNIWMLNEIHCTLDENTELFMNCATVTRPLVLYLINKIKFNVDKVFRIFKKWHPNQQFNFSNVDCFHSLVTIYIGPGKW